MHHLERAGTVHRALLAILVLVAVAVPAATASAALTLPPGFDEEVIGQDMPGSLNVDFAPDGRMFVATSTRGYMHIFNPGAQRPSKTHDLPGALYGLQLDAEFAKNGYVYAVRTQNGHNSQRLVRYQVAPTNELIGQEKVLVGGLTSCKNPPVEEDCMSALGAHDTGTIRTDPRDGTIWFGNGDNQDPGYRQEIFGAQADDTLTGKILHVDREGRGLPNHPYCRSVTDLDRPCTKIWAKGMRNPYRFHWRPDHKLLVADVGWNNREEVTLVDTTTGGRNLGWPCYEGSLRTPSFRDDSKCLDLYRFEGSSSGALMPQYEYAHVGSNWAVIGGPAYQGGRYPADFIGDSFIADFGRGWIKRLEFDGAGKLVAVKDFATGGSNIVDLELAPNGDLVYTEISGRIAQIHSTSRNRVPTARAAGSPTSGQPPLRVAFSSAGSSDPDGDPLSYDWDFGDGSAHSTAANPVHTYANAGTYTARLLVKDPSGASASASVLVNVGNTAPTVEVTAPASYRNGQTLNLSATATDREDGALPARAFHWTSELIHSEHGHPGDDIDGTKTYSFFATTDHDADSFYRVTVTVTDSGGATTSQTVDMRPQTVDFSMTSVPSGAPLVYHGFDVVAPFSQKSAIGLHTTISAAQFFSKGGVTYEFKSWSDGGTRNHDIVIPDKPLSLQARYEPTDGGGVEDVSIEGESMAGVTATGAIRRADRPGASGGALALMLRPSALSATVDLPSISRLTVWATAQVCSGQPIMVVEVDRRQVFKGRVPAGDIGQFGIPVDLAPGTHSLRILYQSDVSRRGCDRNLLVDRLVLSPEESAPPPTTDLLELFEAESLTGVTATGAVQRLTDSQASGEAAARFLRNGTISVKRRIADARYAVVRAKGEPCNGDPIMILRRNGTEVARVPVGAGDYHEFTLGMNLIAGDYRFDIAYLRDARTTACDRSLIVDSLTFYADDSDEFAGFRAAGTAGGRHGARRGTSAWGAWPSPAFGGMAAAGA